MTTQNENTKQATNRRGRPNKNLVWPDEAFSAEDVYNQLNSLTKTLSRVSVHSKINKAIASGELVSAGFVKSGKGRPKNLYKKAS